MNHPSEEQLILYYYGEETAPLTAHFTACEECRDEYRKLQRVLNTAECLPVPERAPDYGTQVWKRLQPAVGGRSRRFWLAQPAWRYLAASGMATALLALAFLAGRYAQHPKSTAQIAAAPARERILLVAVGDHLQRSQVVLAELSNLGAGQKGRVDIGYEQRAAEDLLDSSRLFRMTAASNGDNATANLLDELERVLLDVAHAPADVSPGELEQLQKRISDAGILFKVRVFALRVEQQDNAGPTL